MYLDYNFMSIVFPKFTSHQFWPVFWNQTTGESTAVIRQLQILRAQVQTFFYRTFATREASIMRYLPRKNLWCPFWKPSCRHALKNSAGRLFQISSVCKINVAYMTAPFEKVRVNFHPTKSQDVHQIVLTGWIIYNGGRPEL